MLKFGNLDACNTSRENLVVMANVSRRRNACKSDNGGFLEEAETSSLLIAKLLVMLFSQFMWTLLTCKSPRERR
jgi:hypothetical protein